MAYRTDQLLSCDCQFRLFINSFDLKDSSGLWRMVDLHQMCTIYASCAMQVSTCGHTNG